MNIKTFHFGCLTCLAIHSLYGCAITTTSTPPVSTSTMASLTKGDLEEDAFAKEAANAKKIIVEIYNKTGKSGSTAFILEVLKQKTYLLTALHPLIGNPQIKLNIFFHGDQEAKVVKVDDQHNLALLAVENENLATLQVTHYLVEDNFLITTADSSFTMGFPIHGKLWDYQKLSYLGSKGEHLVFAQDNLDEGNLGGPVINGNQIVGMLAGISDGAYVVSAAVIRNFLHSMGAEGQEILAAQDQRRPPTKVATTPIQSASLPLVTSSKQVSDKPLEVSTPVQSASKPVVVAPPAKNTDTPLPQAVTQEEATPASTKLPTPPQAMAPAVAKAPTSATPSQAITQKVAPVSLSPKIETQNSPSTTPVKATSPAAVAPPEKPADKPLQAATQVASTSAPVPLPTPPPPPPQLTAKEQEIAQVGSSPTTETKTSPASPPTSPPTSPPVATVTTTKKTLQDVKPVKPVKTETTSPSRPNSAKEVKTTAETTDRPVAVEPPPQSEITTLNALCTAIVANDWSTFRQQAKFLKKDSRLFYPASNVTAALSLQDKKMVLEQTLRFLFEAFSVSQNEKESRCGPQLLKIKADELDALIKSPK